MNETNPLLKNITPFFRCINVEDFLRNNWFDNIGGGAHNFYMRFKGNQRFHNVL